MTVGNIEEAIESFEKLLEFNSANFETYYRLIECNGVSLPADKSNLARHVLSEEDMNKVNEIIEKYQAVFPRVNSPTRIGLKLLKGEMFQKALKRLVRPLLIKGAPSVMTDLKELYQDQEKVAIIGELLHSFYESMNKYSTLDGEEDEQEQDPTVYLWLLCFLSQHYLFIRELEKALHYINEAIEHTPTLIELYEIKGKIHQAGGDWIRGA